MELKQAIKERRSIKQYEDTTVDDSVVKASIELATYTPNHGMREPWRVVWVKKERLADFGQLFADIAFKNNEEKYQAHIETVKKLAGVLVIVGKRDRRQKENFEDLLAVGGFMQTLSLALFENGVGSCIKTQPPYLNPKMNDALNVRDDEIIYGVIYLTAQTEAPHKERKKEHLITLF
ncbi:nitroreductase [Macrococcoides caseolyticum]|uniref:nitroreductase family protein n=1 Tax=Macrococcoides caseolyticum TaxID=69966 RepID=UPI000C43E2B6|nr:nitroreductase [Macrococcus caseolyticus]